MKDLETSIPFYTTDRGAQLRLRNTHSFSRAAEVELVGYCHEQSEFL
jgi:hypothetical protein